MIVKHIKGRSLPNHARSMVAYVSDETKTDGMSWSLNVLSEETAAFEMAGTAAMAHHKVKNPIMHLVLSWPPEERPSADQGRAAALHLLNGLGFVGHQAVISIHQDTDCTHVHILINRIHPETFKAHYPEWLLKESHRLTRQIEINQGWSHSEGLYMVITDDDGSKHVVPDPYYREGGRGDPRNQDRADAYECRTGHMSFKGFVIDEVIPRLQTYFSKAEAAQDGWEGLHKQLALVGCAIEPRRGGFVIKSMDGDPKHSMKISEIKAAGWTQGTKKQLEKVLGSFRDPESALPEAEIRYNPEAVAARNSHELVNSTDNPQANIGGRRRAAQRATRKAARDALWAEYQGAKRDHSYSAKIHRDAAWTAQKASERARRLELTEQYKDVRRDISARVRGKLVKSGDAKIARMELSLRQAKERERLNLLIRREREELKVRNKNSFPTWRSWVEERAEAGDERAISARRGMRYREQRPSILAVESKPAQDVGKSLQTALDRQKRPVLDDVVMVPRHTTSWRPGDPRPEPWAEYRRRDKVVGRDLGHKIDVLSLAEVDIEAMVLVAGQRFGGTIRLTGPEDFKVHAAAYAVSHGIRIANEDLQEVVTAFQGYSRADYRNGRAVDISNWVEEYGRSLEGYKDGLLENAEAVYRR